MAKIHSQVEIGVPIGMTTQGSLASLEQYVHEVGQALF